MAADDACRGQWADAVLPHAFEALRPGIERAPAHKSAAYAAPRATVLVELAEDSCATLQAERDISRGRDEM